MSVRNKIIVDFILLNGNSQDDGEVEYSWRPINFSVYSNMFQEIIDISCDNWLSENKLRPDTHYEVIFAHVVEHDGAGTVTSEYFDALHTETGCH